MVDLSLYEVFGQELVEHLYDEETQENLCSHELFDMESVQEARTKSNLPKHPDPNADGFFDDFSEDIDDIDSEDLLGMSLLVPIEEAENIPDEHDFFSESV